MNNNSSKTTFTTVGQDMYIISPKSAKGYPISCREWKFMKTKIESIKENVNWYHTIGSIVLGAAITTFIPLITGVIPKNDENGECTTMYIISWSVCIATFVISIICLFFAHKQKAVTSCQSRDVLYIMQTIEERFPKIENTKDTS